MEAVLVRIPLVTGAESGWATSALEISFGHIDASLLVLHEARRGRVWMWISAHTAMGAHALERERVHNICRTEAQSNVFLGQGRRANEKGRCVIKGNRYIWVAQQGLLGNSN
jgi:hypothetical protein